MPTHHHSAVIAGLGPALGASLSRTFADQGYTIAGLRRHSASFPPVETLKSKRDGVVPLSVDVTDEAQVEAAFAHIARELPPLRLAIYNVAQFYMAPLAKTSPETFESVWRTGVYGAHLFARACLPLMLKNGGGTLIFTGATASLRGGANFSAFAAAKFGLRGLSQSLAREYGPQGIHVAHVVVDGMIGRSAASAKFRHSEGKAINPDDLARLYLDLTNQNPSAWTQELDARPASEKY
jgi:NAD(P)-dependent dehydrogenase (short-subunit alcohol dehydrogenase family)